MYLEFSPLSPYLIKSTTCPARSIRFRRVRCSSQWTYRHRTVRHPKIGFRLGPVLRTNVFHPFAHCFSSCDAVNCRLSKVFEIDKAMIQAWAQVYPRFALMLKGRPCIDSVTCEIGHVRINGGFRNARRCMIRVVEADEIFELPCIPLRLKD